MGDPQLPAAGEMFAEISVFTMLQDPDGAFPPCDEQWIAVGRGDVPRRAHAGQFVNALPADRSIAHDQGIELSGMLDGIAAVDGDDVPACIDERVKPRDVVTVFAHRHMADDDPAGEFRRVKHEMRIGHHFAEVAAEVRFVHDAGMGEDAAVIINDLRQGIHPGKLFCIVLVQQIAEAFHVGMGVDRDMQGIGHLMQDARFALQEHLMEKAQVVPVPDVLADKVAVAHERIYAGRFAQLHDET